MTSRQHKRALKIVETLIDKGAKNGEGSLTTLENKTLRLFAELVESYEEKHYPLSSVGRIKKVKIVVVDPKGKRHKIL